MKNEFWRRGIVAILTAGLLAIGAVAQEGEATGEVKIEGDAPPAATATAEVKPATKVAKPMITNRDPFVNQLLTGEVTSGFTPRVRSTRERTATAAPAGRSVRPAASARTISPGANVAAAAPEAPPAPVIPAPEVTIAGIVKAGGSRQAIVNAGASSYIVSEGQKLADYRVSSITDTAVTFTYMGKSFKIPIDSPFGLK